MTVLRGIVLAAGEGRRMGGSKAFLVVDGVPLICAHVARLFEVGCASVTIVVRPESECALRNLLPLAPPVQLVAVCTEAQSESLAAALGSMPGDVGDTLVVTPVDLLPAEVATHLVLQKALGEGVVAATPTHEGRGGHPVVVRRSTLVPKELPPLRTLLSTLRRARVRVEVADVNVLGDFDTPNDLPRLERHRRKAVAHFPPPAERVAKLSGLEPAG